jgi:S-disulfanyl-L-cysteine oxidoreductase SoxD
MFMPKRTLFMITLGFGGALLTLAASQQSGPAKSAPAAPRFGFGATPTPEEIREIDIAVGPNGEGLPPGRGTSAEGEKVYAAKCASCHGRDGAGGPYDQLVGGKLPVKTIGSFWPYATTIFDYTRRAMPFNKPGSLTDQEVYDVTAWLLWKNNIIATDAVIDAKTLPLVKMPNRDGFVSDPRPDVPKPRP